MTEQEPPKLFDQGVEIDIFDDAVIGGAGAFFIEPFGLSDIYPIGGLVGGAFETILIDEGFKEVDGVAVVSGPVLLDFSDI